jgi:hypothetical protein
MPSEVDENGVHLLDFRVVGQLLHDTVLDGTLRYCTIEEHVYVVFWDDEITEMITRSSSLSSFSAKFSRGQNILFFPSLLP